MAYNSRAVHIDRALTNLSVKLSNNQTVGSVLFPSIPVMKQSDKYYVFGNENWLPQSDLRAPAAVAGEIPGLARSIESYYCEEHALQIKVTDEERANADSPIRPDMDATEVVVDRVMLVKERAIASMATNGSNYRSGENLGDNSAQWGPSSNPFADIEKGIRTVHSQIFMEPNVMILPYQVLSTLKHNTAFVERTKYTRPDTMARQLIGSLSGISNIQVPGVGYNSAKPGLSESLGYIWGPHVVLAYVNPRPGHRQSSYGYEFTWRNNNLTHMVDRWRDEPTKCDIIRYSTAYDLKFITTASNGDILAGYLLGDVI